MLAQLPAQQQLLALPRLCPLPGSPQNTHCLQDLGGAPWVLGQNDGKREMVLLLSTGSLNGPGDSDNTHGESRYLHPQPLTSAQQGCNCFGHPKRSSQCRVLQDLGAQGQKKPLAHIQTWLLSGDKAVTLRGICPQGGCKPRVPPSTPGQWGEAIVGQKPHKSHSGHLTISGPIAARNST